MKRLRTLRGPHSFATIIGLTDGILNALTLASGHFVSGRRPTITLSLRIAFGSALCGVFVFFTAEYTRLRGELLEGERQLNFAANGAVATSSLGRQVRREAMVSALFSSIANFAGATLPLWVGVVLPGSPLLAILPSIVALGILGACIAHAIRGRCTVWTLALVLAGIAFSMLGIWLDIA